MRFAVAGRAQGIDAAHPVWKEALPAPMRRSPAASRQSPVVTHGDYFEAVRRYLQNEGAGHLDAALAAAVPTSLPVAIDVILEKHGEFYHPARIRVATAEQTHTLALNVAVAPVGVECMQNEIEALRRVAPRLPKDVLPRVYGWSHIETAGGVGFGIYLADWFAGHHEFHLSIDPNDGVQKMIVWDTNRAPFFLDADRTAAVYRQTAYLLARAYDTAATTQIYPWHHASGDFILRPQGAEVAVKLITVRQYASTLGAKDASELDAESRLMAAMVFFANLTLRNRLDRLDGTGELAWADDMAVAATVAGFKQAMDEADVPLLDLPPLLRSYTAEDWAALLGAVGAQYRLMAGEQALLDRHIPDHAASLRTAVLATFRT